MLDITYVISTHPNYTEPLINLLNSMKYIPNDRKIVVTAASDSDVRLVDDITWVFVPHNSFDFTGLIGILENDILVTEFVFPLHDTMELGMNSNYLISKANPDMYSTAVSGAQCNLNLLRRDYLFSPSVVNFLLGERNASKQRAIQTEGALWRTLPDAYKGYYPNDNIEVRGTAKPYGNAERVVEYYTGIDLIKYKANYGQSSHRFIINP